jgi:hypothetical protein
MSDVIERPANTMQSFIERAARDETFNLDKFRELLVMQREENQLRARHEFNVAMARVQAQLQSISRDRSNPATRSKYATLQAIDAAARPVYTEHGFSVRFGTGTAPWEGWVRVTCELAHVGGYSEQHHLDGPLDVSGAQGKTNKTGIQAIGSTVSYLRRYLMLLVLNLVTVDDDDDDGEAARRDRQAERTYGTREAVNRDVPMDRPTAPQRTPEQLLDGLEIAMRDCGSLAEVNKLIANRHVQDMLRDYKNGDKSRLDGIIAAGIGAHAAPVSDEQQAARDQQADAAWPGAEPAEMENASA